MLHRALPTGATVDFRRAFTSVTAALSSRGVDFALIGGFALSVLGVPRTTVDIDFLVAGEHGGVVDGLMRDLGYEALHRSSDVANYRADGALGRVDFLFARRAYSHGMLARATAHTVLANTAVKVVQVEDLIGLKVQSSSNDPTRLALDLGDIQRLLSAHPALDLERVREYFGLFAREPELDELLSQRSRS